MALLGYLAGQIEWPRLGAVAHEIRISYFLFSLAMLVLGEAVVAVRLRILMRPTVLRLPILRIFKIGFMSRFYALFLPAGIAQGVARWYKVTENRAGRLQFVVVSLVEKSLFLSVTALCVGLPLLYLEDERFDGVRTALMPLLGLLLLILCVFFLLISSKWFLAWVRRRIEELGERAWYKRKRLLGWVVDLGIYSDSSRQLVLATILTVAIQGLILLRLLFLFRAAGADLAWIDVLWMGSLVFMVQTLPVSLAGLGVRESGFAYAFGLFGLGAEMGLLVGLLFSAQFIMTACAGGILEITDRGHLRPQDGMATGQPDE